MRATPPAQPCAVRSTGNDISRRRRRSDAEITVHRGRHEALVSLELFDQARAALRRKGGKGGRPPQPHNPYLLQGFTRCAVCGGRMTCSSPEPGRARYICVAHERGLECASARIGVREGSVAPQIDAIIERLRVRDGVLEAAREIAESDDERSRLTDKRAEINAELKRLDHMFQKGRLTQSDYDRRVDDLQLALSQLRPIDAGDVDSAGPRMASLVDAWKAANARERNGILKALIRSVTLDARSREVVGIEPLEDFAPLFQAAGIAALQNGTGQMQPPWPIAKGVTTMGAIRLAPPLLTIALLCLAILADRVFLANPAPLVITPLGM